MQGSDSHTLVHRLHHCLCSNVEALYKHPMLLNYSNHFATFYIEIYNKKNLRPGMLNRAYEIVMQAHEDNDKAIMYELLCISRVDPGFCEGRGM